MRVYRIEHIDCNVRHGHGPAAGRVCDPKAWPKFGNNGPTPDEDPVADEHMAECRECHGKGRMQFVSWDSDELEPVDCWNCRGLGQAREKLRIREELHCAATDWQFDAWWADADRELHAECGWRVVEYEINSFDPGTQYGLRQVLFNPRRAVRIAEHTTLDFALAR